MQKIDRNSLIIWMIPFAVCFVCLQHKWMQETLWDRLHQLLAQFLILVNLFPRLIDHQPLDPSHNPAQNFLLPTDLFLLSVIPLLRSANWYITIPLIWVRSNYSDVFWFTWLSLHYKYLALSPTLESISGLNTPAVTVHLREHNTFFYTLL